MDPKVKICGVRDAAGLRACLQTNVDAIGFNFVPSSARYIAPADARALLDAADFFALDADARPKVVAVFRDQRVGSVTRMASALGADVVQLHGDEPPAYCAAVAGAYEVWKALSGPDVGVEDLRAYADWADALLIDGRTPGAGEGWDWAPMSAWLTDGCLDGLPVWLAGGLSEANVEAALRSSGAFGADVASGVETDGVMDPERVLLFARAARGGSDEG